MPRRRSGTYLLTHLLTYLLTYVRSMGDSRVQISAAEETAAVARRRERDIEEKREEARQELEAERAEHSATALRLEQAVSEREALSGRLGAQLERERERRGAAERRAAEAGISLQVSKSVSQ